MAVARRTVAPPPAPTPAGAAFGDLGFYGGSFNIPEADYALTYEVMMHAGTKQDGTPAGPERLGVMVLFHPIDKQGNSKGEAVEKFLSMGTKAHESWAPNPETGKGIVPVAGGAGANPSRSSNWALHLKSLYDSGLPMGIFSDDVSVLDGVWAHVQSQPEPEERKGFGAAKTGEAGQEEKRGTSMIPTVTEILEGGKPWEGSGGVPDAAAAPAPKAAPAKPAAGPRAVARPAAAAPAPAASAAGEEDVETTAINGVTTVLSDEKLANGCSKLQLRTGTFKAVSSKHGDAVANEVLSTYFANDTALNGLLGQLGYKVEGAFVKVA